MKKILILFAAMPMLFACHPASNYEGRNPDANSVGYKDDKFVPAACSMPPPPAPKREARGLMKEDNKEESIPLPPQIYQVPEMIIRNADLRFSVADYRKGRTLIGQVIKTHNGWLTSENEENNTADVTNKIVIRVLSKDFDALVSGLSGIAKQINTKTISADDVTAEFVDVTSRLKTKKEIDAQYLELLKRANKISDILEIEEKERVLREEIEASEGELKLMKDRVSFSTIRLVFYQDFEFKPEEHPGFWNRSLTALGTGWKSCLVFVISVLSAWPFLILFAGGGFWLIRIMNRRRRKSL